MPNAFDILTSFHPDPEPFVRWLAMGEDNSLMGGMVETSNELKQVARISEHGLNVYVQLNPTTRRMCKRANMNDVVARTLLLIDIDPLGGRVPPTEEVVEVGRVARATLAREISPYFDKAALIYSGRGVQLWVRLEPTYILNQDTRLRLNRAGTGFLQYIVDYAPVGYRIDPVGDLSRIARLPGSINQRTGRTSYIVEPGEPVPLAPVIERYMKAVDDYLPPPQGENLSWQDVRDLLTITTNKFIDYGAPEGRRHGDCWHAIKNMKEHGVSEESAWEAALQGAKACYPNALHPMQVRTILNQVYRKG